MPVNSGTEFTIHQDPRRKVEDGPGTSLVEDGPALSLPKRRGRPPGSKNKPKNDPAGTNLPPAAPVVEKSPESVPNSGAVEPSVSESSSDSLEKLEGNITSDSVERPFDFSATPERRGGLRTRLPSGKGSGAGKSQNRWFWLLRRR